MTRAQLCKASVRSHHEFSNCDWSPSLHKHIEIIDNVQRRVTKLISLVSYFSYPDRLAKLNLPTMSNRIAWGDIIEVFKTTFYIYDQKVTKFFTYRNHTVTRGSQIKQIYQPFCRNSIRRNYFSIRIFKFCIR